MTSSSAVPGYSHGHQPSVLASHATRTAANSCGYLRERLRPGLRVLDVGCGPGSITLDLAECVGPTGGVLGVDLSPEAVTAARAAAMDRGDDHTEFVVGNLLDLEDVGIAPGSFDVVHAHQVLQHVPDPVATLRGMARFCGPGGIVAVRDADYGAMTWFPEIPGLERWRGIHTAAASPMRGAGCGPGLERPASTSSTRADRSGRTRRRDRPRGGATPRPSASSPRTSQSVRPGSGSPGTRSRRSPRTGGAGAPTPTPGSSCPMARSSPRRGRWSRQGFGPRESLIERFGRGGARPAPVAQLLGREPVTNRAGAEMDDRLGIRGEHRRPAHRVVRGAVSCPAYRRAGDASTSAAQGRNTPIVSEPSSSQSPRRGRSSARPSSRARAAT